ncbi:tRNA (guanosine(37)-N1)-methyltransferase TrmD [Flavobacteriaceae bacterium]|jgi:tRNA (guanine37-N1)-methyltransferase|nr:tRNA (guanosine(37)-N1)-methyltransferase TrmD [Flavobacteriaceae bacterium]MDA9139288.1 tRNA (guanosine(37)-N1)-methyltransferase TrmD [Flavobacteriaceae bacterium]MDA9250275.1 tRNA (guanosine(37)-N1)-methyltransferase TrmD [Flavobacteriaceae bacterium]|tara:strand:+ start:449 stop:1129 length:681 start_codon:yes stop_codon:yes gene_type:complete
MRIDIITLFPELLSSPFEASILKRAIDANKVIVNFHNPRDYSTNKHKKVDDYPFGGGAGMVMTIEPIDLCLEHLKKTNDYDEIIYLTPDGEQLAQNVSNELSLKKNIIIICGHYKGIDQRVRDHLITREISIGDFVLSGGELAAAVLCDSIIRLIPGVIGDESSALTDSYQDGLLAPPIYTRPAKYKEWSVPEILTSGDTPKVDAWREEKALEKTQRLRPDLLNED